MSTIDPYIDFWLPGDFNRRQAPPALFGMPVMLDRSVPPDTVRVYGGGRRGGKMLLLAQLVARREAAKP